MPAAYQASGALSAVSSTTITPALPAHQADDILICVTSQQDLTRTCSTPSGWSLLAGPITGSSLIRTYFFWKQAASGSETNPSCVWSASGNLFASCHSVRGAYPPSAPFDVTSGVQDQTDPFVVSGVTTAKPGELILLVGSFRDQIASAVTVTATDPPTFSQHFYAENGLGGNITQTVHSAYQENAGATGNITFDFNAAMPDDGHVAVIAFKDAALFARPGAYATAGEAATLDDSGTLARVTANPVDALILPTDQRARISALPVDVLVLPDNPFARISAIPVDVLRRRTFDRPQVIWEEER